MASINQACNVITPSQDGIALAKVLESIRIDMEALRASHAAMATKLNADAGVTDVNYASVATLNTTP